MRNFSSFSRFSDLSISPEDVLSHAYKTGFCSRIGKIHPCDFWESFCVESMRGVLSHNDLAARMDAEGKVIPHKNTLRRVATAEGPGEEKQKTRLTFLFPLYRSGLKGSGHPKKN